jgi:hypothetical protein
MHSPQDKPFSSSYLRALQETETPRSGLFWLLGGGV